MDEQLQAGAIAQREGGQQGAAPAARCGSASSTALSAAQMMAIDSPPSNCMPASGEPSSLPSSAASWCEARG
jgi:hypothetical protein